MNEEGQGTFRYRVGLADLQAFHHELAFGENPVHPWLRAVWTGLILALCLGVLVFLQTRHVGAAATVAAVAGCAAVPLLRWLQRAQLRASVRELYAAPDEPALGEHELELSARGLAVASLHHRVSVTWLGIRRVRLTRDHAFLVLGTMRGVVVPRAPLGEGAWRLEAALREHLRPDQISGRWATPG